MGETLFAQQRHPPALADAEARGRPFADAVHRQHRRFENGEGKKADAAWDS
jgi:hypothetical protein